MTPKELLLLQLKAVHDTDGWFVSFQTAVKDLTEEDASKISMDETNSIREIINHLIYYNEKHLNRFKQMEDKDHPLQTIKETFHNNENHSWDAALLKIDSLYSEWESVVKESIHLHDWEETIAHITMHNAYHIGQIVHIRKQFHLWNDGRGIN
ncbi:hypothetical protein M948_21010 [Virgibacillus sp. CM-4]|uniref:DinB superfamily protein n=1 Tax=Virgibacillus massiliensis TaxID=1462526 RepID=A0A024QFU2_9BACI|nr:MULTISPECIES: DinB family protein [Virgibacillus]EQB34543.1 hypothetical protein M948_21010 [Virgibacillus sp. CM-4]CDQ41369.1 DinB superfamily protein [Virgibacillus massiliensis]